MVGVTVCMLGYTTKSFSNPESILDGEMDKTSNAIPLKEAFKEWFEVGVAISEIATLSDDEVKLLIRNFDTVTPEKMMKPDYLNPDKINSADAFAQDVTNQGLKINGHTLIWYRKNKDLFSMECNTVEQKEKILEYMRIHVKKVVGHLKGQVASWDVVNEILSDNSGASSFRKSNCSDDFIKKYIMEAFIATHKADSTVELIYNDYGVEYPTKRAKVIELIETLREADIPISGVGIQAHYTLKNVPFEFLKETFDDLRKLNETEAFKNNRIKVFITELDIDVLNFEEGTCPEINSETNSGKDLAHQYAELFKLFIKYSDIISRVSFWGLHDGKSWLNTKFNCKQTNHPLLWGRDLQPKKALFSILDVAKNRRGCEVLVINPKEAIYQN